jgi:hypothetical protein
MGSIRCYLEQLHFNLFDLRYVTLFHKRTNITAFARPFPKKGAVYRVVFGKKRPNTSVRLSLLKSLLKVALIPSPPPKCWFFLVFHKKEPLLFFRWVVLVRHFLLLKGILVQDSFAEKDPYV